MGDAMSNWWQGVAQDFSDIPDPTTFLRMAVRLLVAALLGGVIGLERERRGKEAGMRTHMLVGLGAALFVLAPQAAGASPEDLTRVVQGVAAGIGFVGAGAILKVSQTEHVRGLTTAAGIWLTASVGVAAGLGRLALALLCVILALLILQVLSRAETARGRADTARTKQPSS
jgi:putative Mg2+ transporter-C (MgtC) family protein